ncbi:MAG: hypothetical protein H7Y31_02300 [Chitinophagaceae bacterium]|nr:hypothetical protein [Chitinophagaceae bacterium]
MIVPGISGTFPFLSVGISRSTVHIITADIYFVVDSSTLFLPKKVTIEAFDGSDWKPIELADAPVPRANTVTRFAFEKLKSRKIRFSFKHSRPIAISEIEVYE